MVLERNFEWFFVEPKMVLLWQWFSNLSCKHRCPAYFVSLPYQTHLIQLISSLVETARPELGVSDKGDIQIVQGRGACSTGLKTTVLWHCYEEPFMHLFFVSQTLQPKRGHWMLNSLSKLFEHKCELEVCVHIHLIMIKTHLVFFFLIPILKSLFSNQAVLRVLSEWCSLAELFSI